MIRVRNNEAGHAAVSSELLCEYYSLIRRRVRLGFSAPLRPRLDEDDIVQEVLLRALIGLRTCEYTGEAAFVAWLKRICRNELANAWATHTALSRDLRKEQRLYG